MQKAIATAAVLAYTSVPAAIIDHGTYIEDTDSGIYWLKLTESMGYTYDEVSAEFNYGEDFAGWRYADREEVDQLITNYGIPPTGASCGEPTSYCGAVPGAYAETLEGLIKLLGDTEDYYYDSTNNDWDIAPDGAGWAAGLLGQPGDADDGNIYYVYEIYIRDSERVSRATGNLIKDVGDGIWYNRSNKAGGGVSRGHFLVRSDHPDTPQYDPAAPDTTSATLFDALLPETIGISFDCPPQYYSVPVDEIFCYWDDEDLSLWGVVDYTGTWVTADSITMVVNENGAFDWQLRPWIRVTGWDYTSATCDAGDTDLADNWCRKTVSSPQWVLGPDAWSIAPMAYLPATSLDNIELEFQPFNMTVDYDPQDTDNLFRPKKAGWNVFIEIETTSTADGEAFDFDASTIDPATVRVGPDAAHALEWGLTDYDNDGDNDLTVKVRIGDTGIDCLADGLTLAALTLSGDPVAGRSPITTIGCEETVNIDVDPFNDPNVIRPDDSYNVTVAILGSRLANGDLSDVHPGTGGADDIALGSLKFGPGEAPNNAAPTVADINADSLDDLLVSFDAFSAGIACDDTELQITGNKISGIPIVATDSIVTEDCTTSSCHP